MNARELASMLADPENPPHQWGGGIDAIERMIMAVPKLHVFRQPLYMLPIDDGCAICGANFRDPIHLTILKRNE